VDISTGQIAFFLATAVVVVNLSSVFVMWRDKRLASRNKRGTMRIREGTLLFWALVGGWPGGIWAMRRFRHKTSKWSFIARYALAVVMNIAVVSAVVFAAIS
jgi:uncharacterized membrane protein YsdA (DUF1294 family)